MIRPYLAAIGARLMLGHEFNGELEPVEEPFRSHFRHLAGLPKPAESDARHHALHGFLAARPDRDDIIKAIAAAPVEGPLPEAGRAGEAPRCATLADVRRIMAESN